MRPLASALMIALLAASSVPWAWAQDESEVDAEIDESDGGGSGVTAEQAGLTFIRADAGVRAPDGWYKGSPEHLGAQVSFPCSYSEYTMDSLSKFTPHEGIDTATCDDGQKISYAITRTRYRDKSKGAESMFRAMLTSANLDVEDPKIGAKVAVRRFQGFESFDKASANTKECELVRTVLAGPTLYTIAVMGSETGCSQLSSYGGAFLNAVVLEGGASE